MIVYKVTNLINNKVYVGKTTNSLLQRRAEHYYNSRKNNKKTHFHCALKKYGEDSFEWSVIHFCTDEEDLNKKEVATISDLSSAGFILYNKKQGGDGGKHSQETKTKISLANKGKCLGRRHSPETILRMKQVQRTKEWKEKISESNRKRVLSEETKKKISTTSKLRKTSLETRIKLSQSRKGKKFIASHRANIGKSLRGRCISRDSVLKCSASKGNKPFLVYDVKNSTLVGRWEIINECARDLKINKEAISHGLRLRVKKPRKFIFKYE